MQPCTYKAASGVSSPVTALRCARGGTANTTWSSTRTGEHVVVLGNRQFSSDESLGAPPPNGFDAYHSLEHNGETSRTGTWTVIGGGDPPTVPLGSPARRILLVVMLTLSGLFWGSRRLAAG
jgi:hypothetical protein